jgi:hypothetical protein
MKSSTLTGCSIGSPGSSIQQTGAGSDPAKGSTATLVGSPAVDRRLNLTATVETDADGDGFGDDSQDLCPANATTQGACPSAPDTVAPVLSQVSLTNKTFRVNPSGKAAARRRAKKGTTFRYTLSEAATVTFTIERKSKGRRVAKKCRKRTRKNRARRPCRRYTRVGSFSQAGAAGKNNKQFSGKIGPRKLRTASYRASLRATGAAGNRSEPESVSFRVVR